MGWGAEGGRCVETGEEDALRRRRGESGGGVGAGDCLPV